MASSSVHPVGDDGLPARRPSSVASRWTCAALRSREAVGLVDGDDAQPGEDRGALGLASQQDRPGGLAGVLDELARGVDGAGDGALQVAVVAAVELGLVAAVHAGFGRGHGGLGSVGGCMRPDPGRAGRRPARCALSRAVRRPARPTIRGEQQPDRTERASRGVRPVRPLVATGLGGVGVSGRRSSASSMRRAIASIVCGVFADRVQRAVFAPAGDVGDRLAADVEADGGADDVGDAVDEHLGLARGRTGRSRGRARARARARACGPGGWRARRRRRSAGAWGRTSRRARRRAARGSRRGSRARGASCCSGAIRWRWLSPSIGCAGGVERDGLDAGQRVGHRDVEDRHGAEEDRASRPSPRRRRRAA